MKKIAQYFLSPYKKLMHLKADPRKIAGGFALGSFIGMTPFVGLQVILSVSLASIAKLNRLAAGLGVFNTNLATGLFIFSFNYYLGSRVLGLSPDFTLPEKLGFNFLRQVIAAGSDVFFSLLVGGIITGIPVSILVYQLIYRFLKQKQLHN